MLPLHSAFNMMLTVVAVPPSFHGGSLAFQILPQIYLPTTLSHWSTSSNKFLQIILKLLYHQSHTLTLIFPNHCYFSSSNTLSHHKQAASVLTQQLSYKKNKFLALGVNFRLTALALTHQLIQKSVFTSPKLEETIAFHKPTHRY